MATVVGGKRNGRRVSPFTFRSYPVSDVRRSPLLVDEDDQELCSSPAETRRFDRWLKAAERATSHTAAAGNEPLDDLLTLGIRRDTLFYDYPDGRLSTFGRPASRFGRVVDGFLSPS